MAKKRQDFGSVIDYYPYFKAWSKTRLNNNKPIMMNQATCDSGTKNNDDDDGKNSINGDGVNLWSGLPEDPMDRILCVQQIELPRSIQEISNSPSEGLQSQAAYS